MKLFFLFILQTFILMPALYATDITPEQLLKAYRFSDLQLSPDGEKVAFEVSEPTKGADRNVDIWIFDGKSQDLLRFAASPKSDNHARWSPDGKSLAFLSNRADSAQIYILRTNGGEAVQLTSGKNEVTGFEWSPDGKQIAFLATDAPTEEEEKKKTDKDDAYVTDHDDKPTRLWVIDVDTKNVRAVTSGSWSISEFQWMPSGDQVIASATDRPAAVRPADKIYSIKISDGTLKAISSPAGSFGSLQISKDGRMLSYVADPTDGPNQHDLFVEPLTAGAVSTNVTSSILDRPISSYAWLKEGQLLAIAEDGFENSLYKLNASAKEKTTVPLKNLRNEFAQLNSGIAYICGNAAEPDELCFSNASGEVVKISHFNKDIQALPLVKPEFYRYKSFDGTEIEAALLKPTKANPGKLPLIVLVHGGPTGRWPDAYEAWGQLLVSRGYAVFYPNVRGSTGYGYHFIEVNRKDWGGGDYKDIMAGVDDLIQRGIADPNRLGIVGWSYGGYMAGWAITQTDRFKAAVAGAGMSDVAAEFGTEEHSTNFYDAWFNGTPYENQELYIKMSPISHIKNAKTPTLILQGQEDVIDPIGQSQALYRGLRYYGVETVFVQYPREPHGLREEKHRIDCLTRILDWFDKHLN